MTQEAAPRREPALRRIELTSVLQTIARTVPRLAVAGLQGNTDRKVSVIRLLILFALLPILWWDVVRPDTELVLIGLTALIAAYILVAMFIVPRLRRTVRQDLLLVIDILAITALVWLTGGINSSLLFL